MQVPPGTAGQMPAPSTGLQVMALEKRKVAWIRGWTFGHAQSFDPQPSLQTELTAAAAECPVLAPGPGLGPLLKRMDPGIDRQTGMVPFTPSRAYGHV